MQVFKIETVRGNKVKRREFGRCECLTKNANCTRMSLSRLGTVTVRMSRNQVLNGCLCCRPGLTITYLRPSVAVTGLPKPQSLHAVIMSRFAAKCLHEMNQVCRALVAQLGEDTETLGLRVGLHSGAVTVGADGKALHKYCMKQRTFLTAPFLCIFRLGFCVGRRLDSSSLGM